MTLGVVAACTSDGARASRRQTRPNVCDDGRISRSDVTGILGSPITGAKAMSGDPASCEFITATSANIAISVRPGMGNVTVGRWLEGRMPLEAIPVDGVGERAVWQSQLHEMIAEQNDVLCDVTVIGPAPELDAPLSAALPIRVGEICTKVFATLR